MQNFRAANTHIAYKSNQKVLYRDFNAKVGNMINGNKAEVSKPGNIHKGIANLFSCHS